MEVNDRSRILNMLQSGKITVEEADKLLEALGSREQLPEAVAFKDTRGRKPKKLRVVVDSGKDGNQNNAKVNISIPFSIIKTVGPAIIKNLPRDAKQKLDESGVDIEQIILDVESIAENGLNEDIVNVDTGDGEKIRIYLE